MSQNEENKNFQSRRNVLKALAGIPVLGFFPVTSYWQKNCMI